MWTISKKRWKGGVDYTFSTDGVLDSGGDRPYGPDEVADNPSRFYFRPSPPLEGRSDVPPYDCAGYWK